MDQRPIQGESGGVKMPLEVNFMETRLSSGGMCGSFGQTQT